MKNCMIWHWNKLFSRLFIIQKYRHPNGNFNFIIRFDFVIPIFLDSVKLNMLSSLHAYFESLTKEWYKLTRTSSFVLSETKTSKMPFFSFSFEKSASFVFPYHYSHLFPSRFIYIYEDILVLELLYFNRVKLAPRIYLEPEKAFRTKLKMHKKRLTSKISKW